MKTLFITAALMASAVHAHAASSSEQSCRACHTMDSKLVGPAFKDIAASYRNDGEAISQLKKSMLEGSTGKWGSVPMPANAGLSAAEAEQFARWIMSLNPTGPGPAGKADAGSGGK
ncbi:MAG: c-type cytochrome [Pseudomonadota bacterium]